MKSKALTLIATLFASLTLSACDPGVAEYGYAYNPKGVLYKVFENLKSGEFDDDWIILFSGKMVCYYTSGEGVTKLKKTIGNMNTALDRFRLEQPVLVQSGKTIKGYRDVMGTIIQGERYQARVIRNSDDKVFFTAMISCFKEKSSGSIHQYCTITDLKNHILGNPDAPVCEDLK